MHLLTLTIQYIKTNEHAKRLITAVAPRGLVTGSLLGDRAKTSPAHRSAEPGPPLLASLHCKQPGVCPFWHGALSADGGFFGAWPMSADRQRRQMQDKLHIDSSSSYSMDVTKSKEKEVKM